MFPVEIVMCLFNCMFVGCIRPVRNEDVSFLEEGRYVNYFVIRAVLWKLVCNHVCIIYC